MVESYQSNVQNSNNNDEVVAPIICKFFGGDSFEVVHDRSRQIRGIDIVIRKGDRVINVDTKHAGSRRVGESVVVPWERVRDGRSIPQDFFNERSECDAFIKVHREGDSWVFHVFDFRQARDFFIQHKDEIVRVFGSRRVVQDVRGSEQVTVASIVPIQALIDEGISCKKVVRKD